MIKRICALIIAISVFFAYASPTFACDDEQTNYYVTQILFGDKAAKYENDEKVKMLTCALYLCSEQADKSGQDKLNFLEAAKVGGVPAISEINVKGSAIFTCAHQKWENVPKYYAKKQKARKEVLRNTVEKVFDFGWFDETFRDDRGQIDSFAAVLYYSHILADYLADEPQETAVSAKGYDIPAYTGQASWVLNGNVPEFTNKQKREFESYKEYSDLDEYGRCGPGITIIGPDTLENVMNRNNNAVQKVRPTGWIEGNVKYEGIIPNDLYNRCHLIAHSLGGADTRWNLITGTRYMNEAMEKYEHEVAAYIDQTGNHVLYRATPVYLGANDVASGVQLEAYSLEDNGKGKSFNVYLYNVQPGVDINYVNGSNELEDVTNGNTEMIPFRTDNPSEKNPDLMYEIQRQLEILFEGQRKSQEYSEMMKDLNDVANEARNVSGTKDWEVYKKLKPIQYKYLEALSKHVPKLLANESFFNEVFN